jgi:hypothetical protein
MLQGKPNKNINNSKGKQRALLLMAIVPPDTQVNEKIISDTNTEVSKDKKIEAECRGKQEP